MNFPTVRFKVQIVDGDTVEASSLPFDAVLLERHFDAPMVELMPGEDDPSGFRVEVFWHWAWLAYQRAVGEPVTAANSDAFEGWAQTVADLDVTFDGADEDDELPLDSDAAQS